MPDPFGDNEALSQEALNAMMNSVEAAESAFASTPADSEQSTAPETAASDDASEPPSSAAADAFGDNEPLSASVSAQAFGEDEELPGAAVVATPSGSPLHMASFDQPTAAIPNDHSELHGFERVQDIPLELAVELGRTRLLIKDILELRAGSIVELEKMAGEPVDILANGLLVARGEVVVIEDAFGVRITEIITSSERKALAEDPSTARAA